MRAIARTTVLLAVSLAAGAFAAVSLGGSAEVATFTTTGDLAIGPLAPYRYNNEGAEYWLPIGDWGFDQRAIMRFDVRSLGGISNLEVNSIVLKLFSTGFNDPQLSNLDNVTPVHPEVHAITAANRDWVEGPGNGYSFTPWTCCYEAKVIGADQSHVAVPWAGSPGLTTAGVDYAPTVLATRSLIRTDLQTVGAEVDFPFSGSSAQLTGLIGTWLADNYTLSRDNPGILIFDPSPATSAVPISSRSSVRIPPGRTSRPTRPHTARSWS